MSSKKKQSNTEESFESVDIYGIWHRKNRKVIFVSLSQEETELEYDLEGYIEQSHVIVCLSAFYDLSSLEQLD